MTNRVLCIVSVFLSVAACTYVFFRMEPVKIDNAGMLVSVLGILVTFLLGWQIWALVDYRGERSKLLNEVHSLKDNIVGQQNRLDLFIRNSRDEVNSNLAYLTLQIARIHYDNKDYHSTLRFALEVFQIGEQFYFGDANTLIARVLKNNTDGRLNVRNLELRSLLKESMKRVDQQNVPLWDELKKIVEGG